MSIPATVERVTVSSGEPMTTPDGTPLQGRLYFTAPDLSIISADDYIFGGTVIVELVDGGFTVDLVPQNATGIDPTGWSYLVEGEFDNAPNWTRSVLLSKEVPSVILADVIEPAPLEELFTEGFVPLIGGTMTGELRLAFGNIDSNVGHDLTMSISTGVMHSSGPIVQDGPTSVNIPMGLAMFVDPHHNHAAPELQTVAYGNVSVTLDDPSDPLTYFMVDDTGTIIQNDGVPTRQQRRQFAILGRAVVLGGTIVNVQDSPILNAQPLATTLDLIDALGAVRTDGIVAAPISTSLTFSLTAGAMMNLGANFSVNPADPNVSPFNAQSPAQFRYVTRDGVVDMAPRTDIDPNLWDDGTGAVVVGGGSGNTTIQRVHCFPTQNVFIQLGQRIYANLDDAVTDIAAGGFGEYFTNPDLVGGGVLTGFIVTTRSATNLADPVTTRFYRATKLGDIGGVA